jgi:hypothetical protein
MATKNSNPLYVVTNKGRDIEVASGLWDVFVKKFHLTPFIEAFEAIFQELLEMVKSYPMLVSVQQMFAEFVSKVEELVALLGLVPGQREARS